MVVCGPAPKPPKGALTANTPVLQNLKPSNSVIPIGFQNVKNKSDKHEESPSALSDQIHKEIPQK